MVKDRDAPRDLLHELDTANREWAAALDEHRRAHRDHEQADEGRAPLAKEALARAQARLEAAGARLADVAAQLAERRRRG